MSKIITNEKKIIAPGQPGRPQDHEIEFTVSKKQYEELKESLVANGLTVIAEIELTETTKSGIFMGDAKAVGKAVGTVICAGDTKHSKGDKFLVLDDHTIMHQTITEYNEGRKLCKLIYLFENQISIKFK